MSLNGVFQNFLEEEIHPIFEYRVKPFLRKEVQPVLGELADIGETLQKKASVVVAPYLSRDQSPDVNPETVLNERWKAALKSLAKLEESYQRMVRKRIDPLFRGARHALMDKLPGGNGDDTEISWEEREINQTLALGSLVVILAVVTARMAPWVGFLLCVPIAVYIVRWGIKQAYKSVVVEHRLTMSVLMVTNQAMLWLSGYYLLGGLIFILAQLGRKLGYLTQLKTNRQLSDIFGKIPRSVFVFKDGVETEIPFSELKVGDVLIITPGQMVPIDGSIVEGLASLDQHRLTGESRPVEKRVGDEVLASTVLLVGRILVLVEKAGEQTVAAQILEMLRNTASHEMGVTTRARQMADRSVAPALIAAAVAGAMLGWPSAIAITSTVFGLNLLINGPLALRNYLLVAARRNILVKDGRSMDLLPGIDTVVFDKTGTLTLEQPHVAEVYAFSEISSDAVLRYAAAMEYRQTHPFARAILHFAGEQGLHIPEIDEASYEVGYGLRGTIEGHFVRVGSERFMGAEGLAIPPELHAAMEVSSERGNSIVMVAVDNEVTGAIELEPTIRPEATDIVRQLRARKLDICIISGDQEAPTRSLAAKLAIPHYFANTLPGNKAKLVEQLQAQGRQICFVGDGINDSIALKKANVSVSIQGATSVAMDAAQIVLMDSTLQQLPLLFQLAEEMKDNLKAAQALAIIPAACIWLGVFFLHLQILGANVIFEASLWAGIANAMRPVFKYKDKGGLATGGV